MAVELKSQPVFEAEKPLPVTPVTYEEFLDWADEDTLAEWVDGEIELMSPASRPHQNLSGFLAAILRVYGEDNDVGEVLTAPFQMKLGNIRRGREPDLIFVKKANLGRLRPNFLDGSADLAVEIVSPESVVRDTKTKRSEYEAAGVPEYWVVDPMTQRTDFFVLNTDGRYQSMPPDGAGIYRSVALSGFWINAGWLWQESLPKMREILREWEQQQS